MLYEVITDMQPRDILLQNTPDIPPGGRTAQEVELLIPFKIVNHRVLIDNQRVTAGSYNFV